MGLEVQAPGGVALAAEVQSADDECVKTMPKTRLAATRDEKVVEILDAAERRILWFTDQLEALSSLRGTMNERARSSEVAAEFVQDLERALSRMLANALAAHVPASELAFAVESFRATVEGTFIRKLDRRVRRRVLTFALDRLMGRGG